MLYFPTSALVVLGAMALLTLLVGAWAGRRVRSVDDFLTAGRRANRWWVTASLFGSLCSALLLVVAVGGFATRGLASLRGVIVAFLWLPFLVWVWAPILQRNRLVTVAEYLGRRFDPGVQRFGAALALVLVLGLAGLELAAFGITLRALTGQPALLWMGILAVVITALAAWGGQLAVLVTDGVQALLLLAGLGVLAVAGLNVLGPGELWFGTPLTLRSLVPEAAQGQGAAAMAVVVEVLPVALVALLANQAVAGRIVAARGERSAGSGLILGLGPLGVILFVAVGVAGLGALALGDLGRIPMHEAADVVLGSVMGGLGGPTTLALLAGLLIVAALSTLDALLVGAAALVAVDLRRQVDEAPSLGRARVATLLAGLAAFGLAVLADALGALGSSAALLGAVVGAPLALLVLGAALVPRLGTRAAWATLGLGVAGGVVGGLVAGEAWSAVASLQGAGLGALCGSAVGLLSGAFLPREERTLAELTASTLSPAWAPERVTLPLAVWSVAEGEAEDDGSLPRVRLPASTRERLQVEAGHEVHLTPVSGSRLGLRSLRGVVGEGKPSGTAVEIAAPVATVHGLRVDAEVIVERVA